MIIVSGGGFVLLGIITTFGLIGGFKPLLRWRRRVGLALWLCLLVVFGARTFWLAIAPRELRESYAQHRLLVWDSSPMNQYIAGGISASLDAVERPDDTLLVVVNGTDSAMDLHADGLWVQQVQPHQVRGHCQLRAISRLTSVKSGTRSVVAEVFRMEYPPQYG